MTLASTLGCASSPPPSTAPPPVAATASNSMPWSENFQGALDWGSPSRHSRDLLARVYAIATEPAGSFLRARHDATGDNPPPAMHYGHGFERDPPRLDKYPLLRFRWRVRQHPNVAADPWLDLGASVYVVMKQPGLLSGGRGFKLGWVAKPAPVGTRQRGLLQVPIRSDAASDKWRPEEVDLCALYRRSYGPCEGERIVYVGVVTDADGTNSVAAGDYADFTLDPRFP